MEDMYSYEKRSLEKYAKGVGNMIDSLLDDPDIIEPNNEADIVMQFAYKIALLRFVQKICSRYDWFSQDMPRILADIETDDFIALFKEAIDMAEDVIKEKEREYGI